ncbi:MAG TPA: 2,3-bisphosphoglycerate-independent phosphoglycerate mutase [Candidatus Nealsonbacteria bacterium]|uniref:Metalloenzyme domain-containing protein n=1 Tax=marine sediment metagenome TaxID=412755 RepID=A0A0F9X3Y6_9ZZZZ|nr:2,3-bisphosphoglycerate-independent phosphoglycerate mutase [Candidatus Nealsonbacteria bacterium]HEB46370.1 2,3-bisphosphoglycerate-independent phosphoglycerate mutase [Candidatus Nealsonbacteria bacterium]
MKIIFIIIDGLGDKPIPKLGNKTPLEAAKTPNLDWLAKNGICGLIKPFYFPWQRYPRSDTAHLALFGYNPKVYYLGRGPYEAAGIGFDLKEGDVALRANFGTVNKNLKVIDRRAGRINETLPLVKALDGMNIEGIKFLVKKSYGHRAVLILRALPNFKKNLGRRGRNPSDKITDSDPHKVGVRVKKVFPQNKSREAKYTAQVLNKFLEKAYQILRNHPLNKKRVKLRKTPANYLLVRGAGKLRKIPSFYQRYQLKACCIAGGALYKGIAKILGMKLIKIKGATGFASTNLKGKFEGAKKALKKPAPHRNAVSGAGYNFIFCHIKAADNLAEDGNFPGKKEFIEKIDKNIKTFLKLKNVLIVVTGDHSTCSLLQRHCVEPVPVLIFGSRTDKVKEFNEKACQKGKLRKINQLNLMPKVLLCTKRNL